METAGVGIKKTYDLNPNSLPSLKEYGAVVYNFNDLYDFVGSLKILPNGDRK
jgi:hypothetical protein